nr:MAG TPA: hypothetical protein [Caudoviricetes sp.]
MSNDGKRGHRLTGAAPSRRRGAHANTQHEAHAPRGAPGRSPRCRRPTVASP